MVGMPNLPGDDGSGGQPQGPQKVQQTPTPFSVEIAKLQGPDGSPLLLLQIYKVTGIDALFLTPEMAKQIAGLLTQAATGIQVASQSDIANLDASNNRSNGERG